MSALESGVVRLPFTVIGEEGQPVMRVEGNASANRLTLFTQDGRIAAVLTSENEETSLVLADPGSDAFVSLSVASDDDSALAFRNVRGEGVVALGCAAGGGRLMLTNNDGSPTILLDSQSETGGQCVVYQSTGSPGVVLTSSKLSGVLAVQDAAGSQMSVLHGPDGGVLTLANAEGKPVLHVTGLGKNTPSSDDS
jgi:hypothetical protein